MLMPEGAIAEPDFGFYNKGKELWAMSYDMRDDMEDLFRHQLETSDRLQGFQVTADVMSGHGSLANILAKEFMRDEAPKAPIMLYAVESRNPFTKKKQAAKYELTELNRSLYMGEMLPIFDMVIPFNVKQMQANISQSPLLKSCISKYQGKDLLYHRSAL